MSTAGRSRPMASTSSSRATSRRTAIPRHSGAPMGLMRLADAPDHRGREPGAAQAPSRGEARPRAGSSRRMGALLDGGRDRASRSHAYRRLPEPAKLAAAGETALATELSTKGWIAFSALTDRGDWDLFVMRPDGTEPEPAHADPRCSRGRRPVLARWQEDPLLPDPRSEAVDNNTYGTYELVIADADGQHAVVHGRDFPWASWGPDGTQLACLDRSGIRIIDVATWKETRRTAPQGDRPAARLVARRTVVRGHGQRAWPVLEHRPDGREDRAVECRQRDGTLQLHAGLDARFAEHPLLARDRSGNRRDMPRSGWPSGDGQEQDGCSTRRRTQHLYGGCASPDGKYLLFTRSEVDLGRVDNSRTSMAIVRMSDTPIVPGSSGDLQQKNPGARRGPEARPRSRLGAALDLRRARARPAGREH